MKDLDFTGLTVTLRLFSFFGEFYIIGIDIRVGFENKKLRAQEKNSISV
jgi:hypothetical protein